RPPVVALDLEGDRRSPPVPARARHVAPTARSCPSGPGRRPLRGSVSRANEASTLARRGLFPSRDAFTRWRETSGRRAMANPEKVDAVAEIVELFRDSDAAVITEYRALSVGELKELRRSLGSETTYAVVKNTLTEIAAREAGIDVFDGTLSGPTAIAFIKGEPWSPRRLCVTSPRPTRASWSSPATSRA